MDATGRKLSQHALHDQLMRIAPFACPPQAFEVIKLARPRGEDMHDEIDVVQKDPFAFGLSFDMQWPHTFPLERLFDLFCNRLVMTG